MTKKTILITGASRGIGEACALKFASCGYHVYINSNRSTEDLNAVADKIRSLPGGSCDVVPGDVGNPEDVSKIFHTIRNSSEGLDVLINNAGIAYMGLLHEMEDDDWNKVIQTNLSSVFYCSRAALPYMISRKQGCIINISSMWGTVGASCEVAYSAAKSGIHGLTRGLAKELAPSNITVNAIACGVIDTKMNSMLSKEDKQCLCDDIPAGRFASPEEVAELVWQIVNSPTYMTGQIIGMDGGYI